MLARAVSAAHGFVRWLREHGETADELGALQTEVVEEVAAERLPDGYELNATFAADHRPVSSDELETALRWLDWARADLHRVLAEIDAFVAGGGQLPSEERAPEAVAAGAGQGKQVDQVLLHVAATEPWFVSRLDAAARYTGPTEPLDVFLAGSRAFLVDGLRRIHAADPQAQRTETRGETWTLAKVLRRAVYHSLDHLEELDRRLAIAEHRAERLELSSDPPDVAQLQRLLAAAGLGRAAVAPPDVVRRMIAGATETVAAWDGDQLVGFARIISDEVSNGYISSVAVAPRWQQRGVGTRLMDALMNGREALKLTLHSRAGVEPFYERLGFGPAAGVMVRPRPPVG